MKNDVKENAIADGDTNREFLRRLRGVTDELENSGIKPTMSEVTDTYREHYGCMSPTQVMFLTERALSTNRAEHVLAPDQQTPLSCVERVLVCFECGTGVGPMFYDMCVDGRDWSCGSCGCACVISASDFIPDEREGKQAAIEEFVRTRDIARSALRRHARSDAREIIKRLKAGERITQTFLDGLATAFDEQRFHGHSPVYLTALFEGILSACDSRKTHAHIPPLAGTGMAAK